MPKFICKTCGGEYYSAASLDKLVDPYCCGKLIEREESKCTVVLSQCEETTEEKSPNANENTCQTPLCTSIPSRLSSPKRPKSPRRNGSGLYLAATSLKTLLLA